jgi:UDP-N-acetylmuramoyl-L-alanyl-D-glutamate--2,6-diaminopimelate ligase
VLFEGCGTDAPRAVVTNVDDEYGGEAGGVQPEAQLVVLKYGWERGDLHAEKVEITTRGTRFDLVMPAGKIAVFSALIGRVNVYNILAAAGAAMRAGVRRRRLRRGSTSWRAFREGLSAWIAASRSPWWWTMRIPTMLCGT